MVLHMHNDESILTTQEKQHLLGNIMKEIAVRSVANPNKNYTSRWKFVVILTTLILISTLAYWIINKEKNYKTAYNHVEMVNLPDNSEILLNANSSLTFADNWQSKSQREVWIEGEAYFKVAKDKTDLSKKFVVHTSDLDVVVHGTNFNVNTHEDMIHIVLEEGSIDIAIKDSNKIIKMQPGQIVSFNKVSKQYIHHTVKTKLHTSWIDGALLFDATPLSEIENIIENNYGYQVLFNNDTLLHKKVDGKIENADLKTLLTALETIFDLDIEKDGKHIYISE